MLLERYTDDKATKIAFGHYLQYEKTAGHSYGG